MQKPSWKLTYPIFEDDFPFLKVGYVRSCRVSLRMYNIRIKQYCNIYIFHVCIYIYICSSRMCVHIYIYLFMYLYIWQLNLPRGADWRIRDVYTLLPKASSNFHGKMLVQDVGVSKNRGTPKWMVYNGKPYKTG